MSTVAAGSISSARVAMPSSRKSPCATPPRRDMCMLLSDWCFEGVVLNHRHSSTINPPVAHSCGAAAQHEAPRRPCGAHTQLTCNAAAESGHLEVLAWLRAQTPPCQWSKATCLFAAKGKGNRLQTLQWLRAQRPPCLWDAQACCRACSGGRLHEPEQGWDAGWILLSG